MFETFDHTADIGLRIRAANVEALFCDAGRGLISLMVDNANEISPRDRMTISIPGKEIEYLMFDWLNELLYRFETEKWLFSDFEVRMTPQGLEATATGEPFDPLRHRLSHEVKAVTYHHLVVEQSPSGWLAEIIFDI
ncbi:MAG: archease [Planctomycetaceae bacterium]